LPGKKFSIVGQGPAQIFCTIIEAVLVRTGGGHFSQTVEHGLGRRKIRKAFRQVDGAAGFSHL